MSNRAPERRSLFIRPVNTYSYCEVKNIYTVYYTAYFMLSCRKRRTVGHAVLYVYKKTEEKHCVLYMSETIGRAAVALTREQALHVLREWRALVRRRCLK